MLMKEKSLDIYLTPRFWKGELVYDGRRPLLVYEPQNKSGYIDQSKPYPPSSLRKLQASDGIIYELSQMKNIKQNDLGTGIKMLICITMYNEPLEFLERTLTGIYKNFRKITKQKGLSPKDIAVVIIQDGILSLVVDKLHRKLASSVKFFEKIDYMSGKTSCKLVSRINEILDQIDIFQKNQLGQFVKKNSGLPPTKAKNISLLYQFQWKPTQQLAKRYHIKKLKEDQPSMQIMACFKHLNGKKLSSHLWFFQGFCRLLNPQFCTLMDIGTEPYENGLIEFMAALQNDVNLGGVSGFMTLDINVKSSQSQMKNDQKDKNSQKKTLYDIEDLCSPIPVLSTIMFIGNFLFQKIIALIIWIFVSFFSCFHSIFSAQRAQLYEYNYSHMLDKNFQSFFKYLNVLPGAWSAYRYQAISMGTRYEENLLQKKYLKMVLDPQYTEKDYKQSNMYLAQDRILCLGIYCQKGAKFNLQYVPNAQAKTDPMDNLLDLMTQRRRWINSSYFAFDYVYKNHSYDSRQSYHDFFERNLMLPIVILFSKLSIINTYLTPAIFFFALFTATHETFTKIRPPQSYFRSQPLVIIPASICLGYIACVGSIIIMSLYKKANECKQFFEVMSAVLGLYNIVLFLIVIAFILLNYVFTEKLTQENRIFRQIILYLIIINTFCMYFPIFMHIFTHPRRVLEMFDPRTVLSYLYYQAAYSHTFVIYAFCNVDDISWGTKGSNLSKQKQEQNKMREQQYYNCKISFIGRWVAWNTIVCFLLLTINNVFVNEQNKAVIMISIGAYSTISLAFRCFFAFLHHLRYIFLNLFCQRSISYDKQQQKKLENDLKKKTFLSNKEKGPFKNNILPRNLYEDDYNNNIMNLPSGRGLYQNDPTDSGHKWLSGSTKNLDKKQKPMLINIKSSKSIASKRNISQT